MGGPPITREQALENAARVAAEIWRDLPAERKREIKETVAAKREQRVS